MSDRPGHARPSESKEAATPALRSARSSASVGKIAEAKRLLALVEAVNEGRSSAAGAYASWSTQAGDIHLSVDGLRSLSEAVEILRRRGAYRTYPRNHLMRVVVHSLLNHPNDPLAALKHAEFQLDSRIGRQRAFVPFWGFHLIDNLALDFGAYRLMQLGRDRYEHEIIENVRKFRVSSNDLEGDLARLREATEHIANVPVLLVEYEGASAGAAEYIDPIADRVAEFMQFATGVLMPREDVKVVDHRGGYFGRFTSVMPVMSDEPSLSLPNLRGNPYGARFGDEGRRWLESASLLELLPKVPAGPTEGRGVDDMLLRAIQLIADGERAISQRQAIVAYVGACDVLFGKRDDAQRYTCTGMALAAGGDFETAFPFANEQYDKRSRSAHDGLSPEEASPARRFAYLSVAYVAARRGTLTSKRAIRAHIEPYVPHQSTNSADAERR